MRQGLLLYKTINPLKTKSKVVCSDNLSISTFVGTPLISLTGSVSAQYYNIAQLALLQDFIDNSIFEFAKIERVVFTLTRSADETTMYNGTHGCSINLGYYPTLISSAIPFATLARDVTSYKIDTMTFEPQAVCLPMLNVWYPGAAGEYNNSVKNPYSDVQNLYGQLAIASDNTTVNAATVKLFNVKAEFYVIFYHRL